MVISHNKSEKSVKAMENKPSKWRGRVRQALKDWSVWFVVAVAVLIFLTETSENNGYKAGYSAALADCDSTYESGKAAGYENGFDAGYSTGEAAGYNSGYATGFADGKALYSAEVRFFRQHTCIVTTTGEKYHHYGCYHIDGQPYYIYNIELAEAGGYLPCLDCWAEGLEDLPLPPLK